MDIELTAGELNTESIPYASAASGDKIEFRIINSIHDTVSVKLTEAAGGSDSEIVINAGVGYDVLLNEEDVDKLPTDGTMTYKLSRVGAELKNPVTLATGAVTITGSGSSTEVVLQDRRVYLASELPDASAFNEGDIVTVESGLTYKNDGTDWVQLDTI